MTPELSNFAARLRETFQGRDAALRRPDSAARCPHQESEFNTLALELFALQFKHNAAYQKICEVRGLTPGIVEHWTRIPAVPAAAFKELELTCLATSERTAVFHSSGTTEQKPSRHFHNAESLAVYEASLWLWFEAHLFTEGGDARSRASEMGGETFAGRAGGSSLPQLLILTPSPAQAPHSSLVHMFETIRQKLGAPESAFVGELAADGSWTLDFDATLAALSSHALSPAPRALLLLGTAFSFVHLLDFLKEQNLSFRLPPGSRVMETGGYKNHSRTMPKDELHALIMRHLGIPQSHIVCEYGMSELSSQAYNRKVRSQKSEVRSFHFPPWARVQIISPETNREVADGETGLIRVFDLANVFSVMAIQTEDLGIRHGDGFELLGRAQFTEPRGCSLMMDEPLTPALSPLCGERVVSAERDRVRG
jgi:hypothetical protein